MVVYRGPEKAAIFLFGIYCARCTSSAAVSVYLYAKALEEMRFLRHNNTGDAAHGLRISSREKKRLFKNSFLSVQTQLRWVGYRVNITAVLYENSENKGNRCLESML